MAFGYEAHPSGPKKAGAPTPFHHPPRPIPERSRTAPMAVPNATVYHESPPPLPPPKEIQTDKYDLGWHMANQDRSRRDSSESTPIRAGSSLLGNLHSRPGKHVSVKELQIDLDRREVLKRSSAIPATHRPPPPLAPNSLLSSVKEEIVPASPPFPDLRQLIDYNKLQSEKNLSSDTLRRSSQAYDQQLLSKIGSANHTTSAPSTPKESTLNMHNILNRLNDQSSTYSGNTPPTGLRSPLSESVGEKRLPTLPRRLSSTLPSSSLPASTPHDSTSLVERHGTPGMAGLNLNDRSPRNESRAGQKRRAQSPLAVDPHDGSHLQEAWQRNVMQLAGGRTSQVPRYGAAAQAGSLSTVASSNPANSYDSAAFHPTQPGTAATSYSSSRYSPNSYSGTQEGQALGQPRTGPYQQGRMHAPSSAESPQIINPIAPPRKVAGNILRAPGLWICDCCSKKPKKFDTEEELRVHEMEKQYICQYCNNRFKNKNEAERHQNSLHLRQHSWSCASLSTFEDAFHATPINTLAAHIPGQENGADQASQQFRGLHATATDTCGYCGQEFINPPVWEARIEHLNQTHKFGECNQGKKFFRADHFRQHLKHSHAGTSGKWTNILEEACRKDEPPPVPLASGAQQVPNAIPGGTPGIAMVGQQALLAAHQLSQEHDRQAQEQAAQQALGQDLSADNTGNYHIHNENAFAQHFASQMQQVQQYQPDDSQQGLNLAQHLQQAQREMAATAHASEMNRHDSPGDDPTQEK